MECPGCKLVDAYIEMDETEDGRYRCCRCGRVETVPAEEFMKDTYVYSPSELGHERGIKKN